MADESLRTWEAWESVHQPYEFNFWVEEGIPSCAAPTFEGWWNGIFEWVEPKGRCLDVGCGARPPFGTGSTAIEPLLDRYKELVPPEWWEGVDAFSQPAENLIPELESSFDTVMCWNCLDHTIGWKDILANLAIYGAPDAIYAIATDFNSPAPGHPGFTRKEFFDEIQGRFRIVKDSYGFKERDAALVLRCA